MAKNTIAPATEPMTTASGPLELSSLIGKPLEEVGVETLVMPGDTGELFCDGDGDGLAPAPTGIVDVVGVREEGKVMEGEGDAMLSEGTAVDDEVILLESPTLETLEVAASTL